MVVSAYKVSPYIAEALDSVFAQTRGGYEVIVVNDGCPDTVNLERALQPYLPKIRYIKLDQNSGVATARNAGISAAESPYVAFLDGDDVYEPEYLETNLGILLADASLDVVWGNLRIFGPVPEAGKLQMDLLPSVGEVNFSSLISLRCNVFASAIVRREMLMRVGMFDVRQRRCEDFDLWLRIAKAGGKFRYHTKVVAAWRRRAVSLSSDTPIALTALLEYCDKVKREFDLTPEELTLLEQQRREFSAQLDLAEGKKALQEGRIEEAIKRLDSARMHYRNSKLTWVVRSLRLAPGLVRWAQRTLRPEPQWDQTG